MLFWTWYLCGGLSDLVDGPVARITSGQSAFGAKLDSAADITFILCVAFAVLRSMVFPVWVVVFAGLIAAVRFAAYTIGYRKFRTFATFHTWLNKATGLVLFLFPALLYLLGTNPACGVICGIGLMSATEELWMMIRSKTLNRDRAGLWVKQPSGDA